MPDKTEKAHRLPDDHNGRIYVENSVLHIEGVLTHQSIPKLKKTVRKDRKKPVNRIDLAGLEYIDSTGVVFIDWLRETLFPGADIHHADDKVQKALETFSSQRVQIPKPPREAGMFEAAGNILIEAWNALRDMLYLTSEIILWSFYGIFTSRGRRKGAISQQMVLIGSNAVGIVGLLSIVLGLIIALQSAAQLR
ncbi:TPA: hypothetical protein DCG86_08110, partial [Candidatus Marinimicrobia bacterium]|nr:hypothetical protein [Candidatus Neomarinimicrobiota bacterium]